MRGLLIFDLDGTLFRGEQAAVGAVWEVFDQYGLERPAAAEICSFYGIPTSEFQAWLTTLCPDSLGAEVTSKILKREMELVPLRGELYPGVREALHHFARERFRMALCTNGDKEYVSLALDSQQIASFFGSVRHREVPGDHKVEMVRGIMMREQARPVVVIGDRGDDVEAARRNGAFAVGAAYGYGPADELAGADAVVARPSDLPDAIGRIIARSAGQGP